MIDITIIHNSISRTCTTTEGVNLHQFLCSRGYQINASCGGNGTCGKCQVVVDGIQQLACTTVLNYSATVVVPSVVQYQQHSYNAGYSGNSVGLAVDIGTTTIAYYFVDMATGSSLYSSTQLNAQSVYGADVMSRIHNSDSYHHMHQLVVEQINSTIRHFATISGAEQYVDSMVVCGNTVMSHLFADVSPATMGVSPYNAVFLSSKQYEGSQLDILAKDIVLIDNISAFVGGDIVSGILSTNTTSGNNLLIDLGTNGEIALSYNGKLYVTATAAGPAFEGANITCGVGGVSGAINRAWLDNNALVTSTIDNAPASGICGSGLFDIIAMLLKLGIVDECGYMQTAYYINDTISISPIDIRQFQLAKSAIASGVNIIMSTAGATADSIDNVYIAGNMGFHLDTDSIRAVRLLPECLLDKVVMVGNSAGSGVQQILLDNKLLHRCSSLRQHAISVDLASCTSFADEYADNMFFAEEL